jgi:hypothetical protein
MDTKKRTKSKTTESSSGLKGNSSYVSTFQEYLKYNSLPGRSSDRTFMLKIKKICQFKIEVEITPVNKPEKILRAYVSGCEIFPAEMVDKLDYLLVKITSEKRHSKQK